MDIQERLPPNLFGSGRSEGRAHCYSRNGTPFACCMRTNASVRPWGHLKLSLCSVTISLLVSLAVTTDVFFDLGLNLDFTQALGLAGVLSLSSLGVVAKLPHGLPMPFVLIDEGRLKEPVGVQIFTVVIIAELSPCLWWGSP